MEYDRKCVGINQEGSYLEMSKQFQKISKQRQPLRLTTGQIKGHAEWFVVLLCIWKGFI
jgi:hypothetical protein